ncbi:MAG: YraN family protein [Candidatus Aminicenantes bacterium]|nr:YraN family protein [Candidatus Aminicenantes bacterium]
MSEARALGRSGEDIAVTYLRKRKFRIVCRGFRFHKGEIDIIARDGDTLVFIEVKTRRNRQFGRPEEAVTPPKQNQIRRLAEAYLAMNNLADVPCRFDVLSLFWDEKESPQVRHIKDAF